MQQHEIHQFLIKYFNANNCILVENHPSYMKVQLTIEMDKALMNRPFYWHYVEKTGGIPNPATLTLITDPQSVPDGIKGDIIHFGSPRLHQIFETTKKLAGYIRLYEYRDNSQSENVPLHPWLSTNIKASFVSDRKKDILFSLGLHLLTGKIVDNFHEKMLKLTLTPKIPDFSFTLSPIIMPKSGVSRLDRFVRLQLAEEDHTWAEKSIMKWESDLTLLQHFYEDVEDKDGNLLIEQKALQQQYEPNINISVINGGMYYLRADA